MKNNVSKKMSAVFLVLAIGMVVFFTFQAPHDSLRLSEFVRLWLNDHGVHIDPLYIRTDAHLIEYFILGISLTLFVKSRGWYSLIALVAGCAIGVLDETIKIMLPGREFGTGDLARDFIGVALATVVVTISIRIITELRNKCPQI